MANDRPRSSVMPGHTFTLFPSPFPTFTITSDRPAADRIPLRSILKPFQQTYPNAPNVSKLQACKLEAPMPREVSRFLIETRSRLFLYTSFLH